MCVLCLPWAVVSWHRLTHAITVGDGQHQKGAAFGFNYAQLQQPEEDPLGLASAEPQQSVPAVPEYRPPFETIPWQLATNLPHDHLTHQVSMLAAARLLLALQPCCWFVSVQLGT